MSHFVRITLSTKGRICEVMDPDLIQSTYHPSTYLVRPREIKKFHVLIVMY